jgi:hypothetical protein
MKMRQDDGDVVAVGWWSPVSVSPELRWFLSAKRSILRVGGGVPKLSSASLSHTHTSQKYLSKLTDKMSVMTAPVSQYNPTVG